MLVEMKNKKAVSTVISICSLNHASVWSLTSELLPKYVKADAYVVYVPGSEIAEFKSFTNSKVEIRSQESLGAHFYGKLFSACQRAGNEARFGWYYQQLLKLEALSSSETPWTIIWDADCVPVRDIQLFGDDGKVAYMMATEYHAEYFRVIERILGLSRIQNHSFVIPGFPMRKDWMARLVSDIEMANGNQHWTEALIAEIDFSQPSGFSETETLGTWVANHVTDSMVWIDMNWERLGTSRFGKPAKFSPRDLENIGRRHSLDIVSFENWDRPSLFPKASRIRHKITNHLRKLAGS